MRKVIAIFDIGKTNKKLLLFDEHFKIVRQLEQKFTYIFDEDGFECDDVDQIVNWIKEEVQQISKDPSYELLGVNFSTYGASLVFLDADGRRITPLYNYLKQIDNSIIDEIFQQYGGKDEFCRISASPMLGMLLNAGKQILWIQKEKSEVWHRTKAILHFPQYLSFVFTGKVVSEPTSIGCHTFFWDFDKMSYHKWIDDHGLRLPQPIDNKVVFQLKEGGNNPQIGIGIHDSSASLVPYFIGSNKPFILVSTGTWCVNMNPFNNEPLTDKELEQDCLCYLTPNQQQVKSSRLFMGHFHEKWVEKLANHFHVSQEYYKSVSCILSNAKQLNVRFGGLSTFFPQGKESFEDGLESIDLNIFTCYEEAYAKLMIDLTFLCAQSINLVLSSHDITKCIYVTGGFSRNPFFTMLLAEYFSDKEVYTSEIDNASALGAAIIISENFIERDLVADIDLRLIPCRN